LIMIWLMRRTMIAQKIASFLNAEIIGNPKKEVTGPGYLHTAEWDELTYCFLKDETKDLEAIRRTNAGVVICKKYLKETLEQIKVKPTLILSECPKYDFARVLKKFFVKEKPTISSHSFIHNNVKMGRNVDIHHGVVIHDGVEIGNNVTVRANAVLGAEGLDYGMNQEGKWERVPHMSKLVIQDNVDIGANTTVQKGILRPTIIGEGTKIGPNCDIVHEVKIGKHCLITGMTLVAGATEVGDHTFIAPHSTIKNSIKIGSNVFVGIGSLVLHDVPDGTIVVGRPAIEIEQYREHRKRLRELLKM